MISCGQERAHGEQLGRDHRADDAPSSTDVRNSGAKHHVSSYALPRPQLQQKSDTKNANSSLLPPDLRSKTADTLSSSSNFVSSLASSETPQKLSLL